MRRWKVVVALAVVVALGVSPFLPSGAAAKPGGLQGAAYSVGLETFEPTLGATANGDLYFSITPSSGVAVGWSASTAKSTDGGDTWTDIGPQVGGETMPPETNDPYIYVDPGTGRIFQFHMSPILTCSILSWSDDGGESWDTNPVGCSPTGVWDHQTIVAAKPRTVETSGYPNVLVQCVNAVYALMCARSLNGGSTWEPVAPLYINDYAVTEGCGAQTGHLTAAPDGTIYLPTSVCGTNPTVFISKDDGTSWTRSVMSDMDTPFVDPSVSIDAKGNAYGTWIDNKGFLHMGVSRDAGESWSKSVEVAPGWTANMPVIVAGDPGKIVVAFPSTDDLPKGYETDGYPADPTLTRAVEWGANLTISTNALAPKPKFRTVVTTGSDPIGRGGVCRAATRCSILIDFIEAVIGPDGRPYAAFVDGCTEMCAASSDAGNDGGTGIGLMATLRSGPRLCASLCWRYEQARGKVAEAVALLHGTTNFDVSDAVGFTVEEMPAWLQRLREQAARSRIEAVSN